MMEILRSVFDRLRSLFNREQSTSTSDSSTPTNGDHAITVLKGVGKKRKERLENIGVTTVGDVLDPDHKESMVREIGKNLTNKLISRAQEYVGE